MSRASGGRLASFDGEPVIYLGFMTRSTVLWMALGSDQSGT